MKKTLLICGEYPLPELSGGNMRTMSLVRFFRSQGTVDIAYSNRLDESLLGNPIFANEYPIRFGDDNPRGAKEHLIRLLNWGERPLPILKYASESERLLRAIAERDDYDYVVVRRLIHSCIVFKLTEKVRMRTIIDFDDICSGSLYRTLFNSIDGAYRKVMSGLNKQFLIRYEKRCLNVGASLFCSEHDRSKVVSKAGKSNSFVVPNIYENQAFIDYDFGEGFGNEDILLFVGTLTYQPNREGLKWFAESIFPEFKKEHPNAKLVVVGSRPTEDVKRLCDNSQGIELHSDVPDVRGYYKKCRAFVVPLLSGGGTRIKILEAASAGRPVLSTPIGAEGLVLADEGDVLLFENADEFTAQYRKLLDRHKYNSLVQNARKNVEINYSVKKFKDIMESVLNELEQKKTRIQIKD